MATTWVKCQVVRGTICGAWTYERLDGVSTRSQALEVLKARNPGASIIHITDCQTCDSKPSWYKG